MKHKKESGKQAEQNIDTEKTAKSAENQESVPTQEEIKNAEPDPKEKIAELNDNCFVCIRSSIIIVNARLRKNRN